MVSLWSGISNPVNDYNLDFIRDMTSKFKQERMAACILLKSVFLSIHATPLTIQINTFSWIDGQHWLKLVLSLPASSLTGSCRPMSDVIY